MSIFDRIDKAKLLELSLTNNLVASRHLLIRVFGEIALLSSAIGLWDSFQAISLISFYCCAIWHGFWGYAGIGHELYHSRVFSKPRINKFLFRLASYLTWSNPEFFRISHNHHHRDTFSESDAEGHNIQEWSLLTVVQYVCIDFRQLTRRISYAFINSFGLKLQRGLLQKIEWQYQKESIAMIIFHGIVHATLWYILRALHANVMWLLLPFTGQIFNRLLAQAQHIGLAAFKEEGPLRHSRTLLLPRWFEFLYAGMNYHAEHHLFPVVPYYNLPLLNTLLVDLKLLSCHDGINFFKNELWIILRKHQ
jgi:fatty acid desaturase